MERIVKKLKRNAIQCKKCSTVIESEYRHDFKWCPCQSVAVDGGFDYARIIGELDNLIELYEYEKDEGK
ncbi:DUF7695 domain-containing protein [Bacillus cereus]|uniref:DUF7695 domain-containing protein n=1 Tax=Bacillus cereus TaxID=1396 RepID=UPI0020D27F7B|nr:hypothetical protein [Bacillus cereus]